MTALRAWFDGRTLRERRLILAALALLAVTTAWLLVIMPIRDALSSARTRYADAVIRQGTTEARVRAVKAIQRGQPVAVPLPLADAVRTQAAEAGLSLITLEPQGNDRVHIAIAGGGAGAVTRWLARLEGEGLLVDTATITAGADGSSVTTDAVLVARAP